MDFKVITELLIINNDKNSVKLKMIGHGDGRF